jgi:transcriptional regulator with XRE-family HTH domain
MKTVGERIRGLKESMNLSSKELCSKLEFNTSTYSKLENDKKSIDIEELRQLTNFYGVSADFLLGIDNQQTDIVMYMQRDKKLEQHDIQEIQMVIAMMDEAVVLEHMTQGI